MFAALTGIGSIIGKALLPGLIETGTNLIGEGVNYGTKWLTNKFFAPKEETSKPRY